LGPKISLLAAGSPEITNDGLTRSGTDCFISVPQQHAIKGLNLICSCRSPDTILQCKICRKYTV